LADLEAACAADVTCGWVSCHADPNDPTNCQRYMFSHTCDVSTQDLEVNWTIHQVGKRCYNWPNCIGTTGTDCTSNSNGGKLADLEAACAADVTCGWVSCHADPNDPTNCQRYMFSGTCDFATQDLELDWSIHKAPVHSVACRNSDRCTTTECVSDSATESTQLASAQAQVEFEERGYPSAKSLGTTCCDSAGVGSSPDCKAGQTWNEANDHCSAIGLRLCSLSEITGGAGNFSGCGFDAIMHWTSDAC